jgi:very-short-patch-repair endonuclease
VVVPRNRKVDGWRRRGVVLRWRAVSAGELSRGVTDPYRTVVDCARDLPFAEALAVADSALRHGLDHDRLVEEALGLATRGRGRALRVVQAADRRAANPFESVLRAIALEVEGLDVEPQVVIDELGFLGRPDLVDRRRRIVIEADSFAFHGTRKVLRRDCERYTGLVLRGWRVVRFAWEHVMLQPDYVRDCLVALVEGPSGRAIRSPNLLWTA